MTLNNLLTNNNLNQLTHWLFIWPFSS